jgi:hypothetical protein
LRFNAIRTGRYAAKFGPYGHPSKTPQHKRTASNESLYLGVLERAAVAEALLLANLA